MKISFEDCPPRQVIGVLLLIIMVLKISETKAETHKRIIIRVPYLVKHVHHKHVVYKYKNHHETRHRGNEFYYTGPKRNGWRSNLFW